MEDSAYWMWTRMKFCEGSHNLQPLTARAATASYTDSWEEQAFAKDSACIWPPRSYTCSFCRREFRSAQALGGHMNVHRRDRARLKQFPSTENSHFLSNYLAYQSQACGGVCNTNPNHGFLVSPLLSPFRVSVASIQEDCKDDISINKVPSFSSSIIQDPYKSLFLSTSRLLGLELKLGREDAKVKETPDAKRERDCDSNKEEEENISGNYKKQRADPEISSTGIEELDLELRLGDQPKVKQICNSLLVE